MVGAETAVIGAAVLGPGRRRQRPVAGLQPLTLRLPVREVVGDQGFLDAMVGATFQVEDTAVLRDDLGWNQR